MYFLRFVEKVACVCECLTVSGMLFQYLVPLSKGAVCPNVVHPAGRLPHSLLWLWLWCQSHSQTYRQIKSFKGVGQVHAKLLKQDMTHLTPSLLFWCVFVLLKLIQLLTTKLPSVGFQNPTCTLFSALITMPSANLLNLMLPVLV